MATKKLIAALVACSFGLGTTAFGQTDTTKPAEKRDLNKEAMKQTNVPQGQLPAKAPKPERNVTKETQQGQMTELQKRSQSSAQGGAATVDKNAPKANPRKAAKDMTPEEQKKLQDAAQKASKP
jgi:hypothetical protein